ncbi:MAG: hydroxyacid dehydrogenase [Verrucomicrobia bacterium]|nr:hydroxyacid dehydrogenase [Verrucomicrobiota bacterium]
MYTILQPERHVTSPSAEEYNELKSAGAQLVLLEDAPRDQIGDRVRSADALLCAAIPVGLDLIKPARRLRVVAKLGTGVDNIDVAAATAHGVAVTNVPGFSTDDVAEHTIALMFACAKRLTYLDGATRGGNWDVRLRMRQGTLAGKTLGLVGFGQIGRAVARFASALGMAVLAYDPLVDRATMLNCGHTEPAGSLHDLLTRADFVSLHAPLIPETHHLISGRELSMMKATACLINCARGPLVDEAALVEALKSSTIAGAGLDVFEEEPPRPDSPVLNCPNTVFTPHCAAHTDRALGLLRQRALHSVLQALRGEWPDNVVNPQVRQSWFDRISNIEGGGV